MDFQAHRRLLVDLLGLSSNSVYGASMGASQGLIEDPRTLAVHWNPGLSEGQPGPAPSGTRIYGVAHKAKLGEAMQGLYSHPKIQNPRYPGSGGPCVRDPRSGIHGVTVKTLGEGRDWILDSGSCQIWQEFVCFRSVKLLDPESNHATRRVACVQLPLASKSSKSRQDPRS